MVRVGRWYVGSGRGKGELCGGFGKGVLGKGREKREEEIMW